MIIKFIILLALPINIICSKASRLQSPITINKELEEKLITSSEYLLKIISQLTRQEKLAADKNLEEIRKGHSGNKDEIIRLQKIISLMTVDLESVLKKIEENKYRYECCDCKKLFIGTKSMSDHRCCDDSNDKPTTLRVVLLKKTIQNKWRLELNKICECSNGEHLQDN